MRTADHFRSEAAKCRTLAKIARDKITANNLLDLAGDYDAEARQIECDRTAEPRMPKAE